MELTIYSTVTLIILVIEFSIAVVIFFRNARFSARIFSALIFVHIVWMIIESTLHTATNYSTASFLVIFSHYLAGVMGGGFLYLCISLTEEFRPSRKIFLSILGMHTVLLPLYGQGFIIQDVFPMLGLQDWGWTWGPLKYVFHLSFMGSWVASLFILYKRSIRLDTASRTISLSLITLIALSLVPISILSVILPLFNIFTYSWLAPLFSLLWLALLSYLIIKQDLERVRIVLAEIFVLATGIVLLSSVFIRQAEKVSGLFSPETILRAITFMGFSVIGYLIIINILRETEQKEKIERLNNALDAINKELEGKVELRTKDLDTSKKHIEIILENLVLGIVEYDTTFRVRRINKATEQLLGIVRNSTEGKVVSLTETGALRPLAKIMYDWQTEGRGVLGSENAIYNEMTLLEPKKREIEIVTVPIKNIPFVKISGFIKLLRDITYEKTVDRAKSNFIALVAHQLNAPLEATGWGLKKILSEGVEEKQQELLSKALTSNENLIQITSDLLTAARIDGNEFEVAYAKNDIVETIQEQISRFKQKIEKKKIHLIFDDLTNRTAPFLFDREKIGMAIKNILGNALDYTPVGGDVTITLGHSNDGYVNIIIQDTGIGIPEEELERLFTKFYRSKEALLMETDRSGLGLYITKHVIDSHKGTIDIASKPGLGVKVSMRIPVLKELQEKQS